jgi:uncharacterized membrane protein
MNNELSFRDALSTGWSITKSRFPLLLAYLGTLILLGAARFFIEKPIDSMGVKAVLGIGFQIVNWYLTFNALGVSLKLIDDKEVSYADFWLPQSNFWFYVLATLLYGLIIAVGTLLLIVPGIIFGLMFMFYGYVMIEKNLGPIEALKESKRLTAGAKWDLFLFSLLAIGLNLLGVLALLVGVLVTMTITFIAMAHLYRQRTRALEETSAA